MSRKGWYVEISFPWNSAETYDWLMKLWKEVKKKMVEENKGWNSDDWMANVFGPLIVTAVAELIKALPTIIQAIIDAFSKMDTAQKWEFLKAAGSFFTKLPLDKQMAVAGFVLDEIKKARA